MEKRKKLIKEILIATKNKSPERTWVDLNLPGHDNSVIVEYVRLLHNDGYIEAIDLSSHDGQCWKPKHLTSAGYDYLAVLSESWVKGTVARFLGMSGKMVWFFIGGFMGAIGTMVANHLFNLCK